MLQTLLGPLAPMPRKASGSWLALVLSLILAMSAITSSQQTQINGTARALIYSATADFRHDSIPTAIQALKTKGPSHNIEFDNTEDPTWFTDDRLAQYDAVVFLQNTGEVLDSDGQAALQRYVNLGGNFAAIHAASDCLRNSTFMERELGAHFDYHPEIQNATVDVIGPSHPSTAMLPAQWHVFDEMYNFKSDPRSVGAVVILSANESSYTDPGPRQFNQGTPHPTAWFQERGAGVQDGGLAGRSWYTSLGHTNATWEDEIYLSHVMAGINWTIQSGTTRATNSTASVGSGSSSAATTQDNSTSTTSTSLSGTSGGLTSPTPTATSPAPTQSSGASTIASSAASLLFTFALVLAAVL